MPSSATLIVVGQQPSTESYFSRWAIVSSEPRSLTATKSMSAPDCLAARKKLRPMRPKPLMPTRTVMCGPFLSSPGDGTRERLRDPGRPLSRAERRGRSRCDRAARCPAAREPAGELLGDRDRAVAAAGAAEGDRQVALALGLVGRQQQARAGRRAASRNVAGRRLARARSRGPPASRPVSGRSSRPSAGWAGSGSRARCRRRAAARA